MKTWLISCVLSVLFYEGFAQLWEPLGGGTSARVEHIATANGAGNLFVCGQFKYAGGIRVDGLAEWTGQRFEPVGYGMPDGPNCPYDSVPVICQLPMCILPSGNEVFVSGGFQSVGGTYAISKNARWDGLEWHDCHYPDYALSLHLCKSELFAFGLLHDGTDGEILTFGRWNGSEFEQFGPTILFSELGEMPYHIENFQGHYYLGGNFEEPEFKREIMFWDDEDWQSVGAGINGNAAVSMMRTFKGHLFVGGTFLESDGNIADHLMAWDGTSWFDPFQRVFFTSGVHDMKVIGNELYIVGRHYVDDGSHWQGPFGLARYDGQTFRSFGGRYGYFGGIEGNGKELFVFGNMTSGQDSLGASVGDTIRFLGRWIGGKSVEVELSQPLRDSLVWGEGSSLTIFPNPTAGMLSFGGLSRDEVLRFEIFDIEGRVVVAERSYRAGDPAVDVSHLPAGVYVVQVRTRVGVENIKLVVN